MRKSAGVRSGWTARFNAGVAGTAHPTDAALSGESPVASRQSPGNDTCGNELPHSLGIGRPNSSRLTHCSSLITHHFLSTQYSALSTLPRLILGMGLLLAAGCSGSGVVHVVPQLRADLPADEPLLRSIHPERAYYRVGADGELAVGLAHHAGSLLGEDYAADWKMSLLLEGLPAGRERLYRIRLREVQGVASHAGDHRRFRSMAGIAVVEAPKNRRLKGRFHLVVTEQSFGVLSGWSPPLYQGPLLVMVGEFSAVEDAAMTDAIVIETEPEGFERPTERVLSRPSSPETQSDAGKS